MKQNLLLFLLWTTACCWGQNTTVDQSFKEALTHYESENYQEAIAVYEQLIEKGAVSSALYFNLANAHYKLHHTAAAIYNYEKAQLLDPLDPAIATNLKFAQQTRLDDIPTITKLDTRAVVHNFLNKVDYNQWAKIAVGCSFLILAFFAAYYFVGHGGLKRLFFVAMLLALFAGLLSISASYFEKAYQQSDRPAILFSEKAELKADAKNTSKTLVTLHEGTKFWVLEDRALWCKVRLPNQNIGWIKKEEFKEIKN